MQEKNLHLDYSIDLQHMEKKKSLAPKLAILFYSNIDACSTLCSTCG